MKRSMKRLRLGARDEMQDHLGVGGRLHDRAVAHQLAPQGQAVGQVAVVADGEAAAVELGEQRLHVAQDGLAGGGIADMADRATCRAGGRSPRGGRSCRRRAPCARSEWKRLPSNVTMPAASWPRCCRACRPSAVIAAASGWPKMPKTPHSSRSRSSSRSSRQDELAIGRVGSSDRVRSMPRRRFE